MSGEQDALFDPGEPTREIAPQHAKGVIGSGAILSDCGTYRYALWRDLEYDDDYEPDGPLVFVMLNPSTADADQDDPTIRRCIGFAREWGHCQLIVLNLYALRATDPAALKDHPDPIGPLNDQYIERYSFGAARTIAAWGANRFVPQERVDRVLTIVKDDPELLYGVDCLGITADGHPRHPLYVPKAQQPTVYPPIEAAA